MGYEIVAIGGSWGSMRALQEILRALPADFGAAMAIVLHRHADSPAGALVQSLSRCTEMPVSEPLDKEEVRPGHVYVAAADYHLMVDDDHRFALSVDEAVSFSRPSVDVLLESVADSYANVAIGVVLTGTNDDGAAGLARLRRLGGYTVCQNPETAERSQMPAAAIAAGGCHRVLELEEIGPFLAAACGTGVRR
jgi:two-component system, chemotaxis family, protein-glutamate methylesterase/glutaminase